MTENKQMRAETGQFRLTGGDAKLTHTTIETVIRKNWWLLTLYAVITIAGLIYTYLTGTVHDVVVAIFVAVSTFLVGLKMLQDVRTVTKETR